MATMTIYGDSTSGNCLKVKWTADRLGLVYDWVEVDVMTDTTRSPAFRAINPAGQVPVAVLADGRPLAQSGAILLHLAEGSSLIPEDAYDRARMFEWMFWEQYSHEPYIAVRRFLKLYLGKDEADIDPKLMERGSAALARMQQGLEGRRFLAGDALSLADIALVAYTRMAHQGGFDLAQYPAVKAWVVRVDGELGLA